MGHVPLVTAADAAALAAKGAAVLLDVREKSEWAALGVAPGAVLIPRGVLEREALRALPDKGRTILVYCQMGARSFLAAQALARLGYTDVRNIAGGFDAWTAARLPVSRAEDGLSDMERRRYARHLVIPEVGSEGQRRLKQARVLLVGAGGLGSPAAVYLACAGVGTLGIVDFDDVDESNLQRQILHTPARVGMRKVESAKRTLQEMNPLVKVEAFDTRLTSENADQIVPKFDVVVDGADNFPTRYLINDACVKHGKPNVHGSVFRFEGQASVFKRGLSPCYRCLYPEPPPPEMTQSCADAGVLGVLPGVIGLLQAVEAIKLILGQGDPLYGRLLVYDALAATFRELKVRANPDCQWCAPGRPFPGYIDYAGFCGGVVSDTGANGGSRHAATG
ncbi:MAG TPA: molybdopterin-synthase adenylyltransferase MoeB [Planctomycetota bacterium]|nr:molybdopterin-synthase adenylyltransferase MoeB [Planctomycetota bacterium]